MLKNLGFILLLPLLILGIIVTISIIYNALYILFRFIKDGINDHPVEFIFFSSCISFVIGMTIILYTRESKAEIFEYKNNLKIEALDYKTAAKECYKILTNNKYPGDAKGLDIIDICANPIKGDIK